MESIQTSQEINKNKITYKNKSFGDDVLGFVVTHVIQPVVQLRPDLVNVGVMYDEQSELGEDTNKYIMIRYDFEGNKTHMFHVDAYKALVALWAQENEGEASIFEKSCLEEVVSGNQLPPSVRKND